MESARSDDRHSMSPRRVPPAATLPEPRTPHPAPRTQPHTGTAVVFLTRSSTKLVLQSSTLGCFSSVSMMKRE